MAELNFQVVHVAKLPKTAHARLEGIIDVTTAERFAKTLRTLIDDMGFLRLILDFQGIDFVNSSGFTQLIDLSDYINEKNGIIVLCNVRDDIINLIQELGISVFYSFTTDVESAKILIADTLARSDTTRSFKSHKKQKISDDQRAVLTAIPIDTQSRIPVPRSSNRPSNNQREERDDNYIPESTNPIPLDTPHAKSMDFPNITSPLPVEQQYEEPMSAMDYQSDYMEESQNVYHYDLDNRDFSKMSVAVTRSSIDQQISDIPEDSRLWVKIYLSLKTGATGTLNLLVQVKQTSEDDPEAFVIHSKNTFITLIPVIKGGRCKPAKMAINAGQTDADFTFRIAPGGSSRIISENASAHESRVEIWYGAHEMKTLPSPNPW